MPRHHYPPHPHHATTTPPSSPRTPQAATCHTALPCAATGLRTAPPPGPRAPPRGAKAAAAAAAQPQPCLAVPNVVQVLREVHAVGEGIVADVAVARSCARLPR